MIRHLNALGSKRLLLSGVSLITLLGAQPAAAQVATSLNPGSTAGGSSVTGTRLPVAPALNPGAQAALQRQTQIRARAATATEVAQQAQAAARASAAGQLAGPVRNGLGMGALNPAVTARTDASQDPTGVLTWQGADLPTQTANAQGGFDVTIQQDQKSAILSWTTFNVGADTTLTFDQQGNKDWIALNRVVGDQIAPSQILGNVRADGTVMVINQNGVLFGAGSQINLRSLIASTLDVGAATYNQVQPNGAQLVVAADIAYRNREFLRNGLLGAPVDPVLQIVAPAMSALAGTTNTGVITVERGASITSQDAGGLILLAAPKVINGGELRTTQGQVVLVGVNNQLMLTTSSGSNEDITPFRGEAPNVNIRGLIPRALNRQGSTDSFVWNQSSAVIHADQGNISLVGAYDPTNFVYGFGAVVNDGVLSATTSVSRNGSLFLNADDVRIGSGAFLSILPAGGQTIPQDAASLAAFKSSWIGIGKDAVNIEMRDDAALYAPGAEVFFGRINDNDSSVTYTENSFFLVRQDILIDSDVVISVAGLADVLVPLTEGQVIIDPAKRNELRDSPLFREGFLNGAAIYLDPRLSGVRSDGVAWIGSPLIDAAAYFQLAGVSADRLMTTGGNVSMATTTVAPREDRNSVSTTIVRDGAVIDISGGWVTYGAGAVRQSQLLTADGRVVAIGAGNADDVYIGLYNGFTVNHARWGVTETYADIFRGSAPNSIAYTEGRDAGSLTLKGVGLAFNGTIRAQAHAGLRQVSDALKGTAASGIKYDGRALQGAGAQLPSGGALIINTPTEIRIPGQTQPLSDEDAEGVQSGGGLTETDPVTGEFIYTRPTATTGASLPEDRLFTLALSGDDLTAAGLNAVSLITQAGVMVEEDAAVTLNPGGVFNVRSGLRIQVDGDITAQSGRIILETIPSATALIFPEPSDSAQPLNQDVVINGTLSVAGRWVNDLGVSTDRMLGGAWLDGGQISITVAPVFASGGLVPIGFETDPITGLPVVGPDVDLTRTIEGRANSILINDGARLNLSGGGRVDQFGNLDLKARGGSLSLKNEVSYYPNQTNPNIVPGSGISVPYFDIFSNFLPLNPERVNGRVAIADGAIQAHGFGGGGVFDLTTPQVQFGDGPAETGTNLSLDFFSETGFGAYRITSNKTELTPGAFGFGGFDAILATQTLTVGAGQTLNLTQSVLPNLLDVSQQAALRGLTTGGDVNTVVSAITPTEAWDQRAISLTLGGLLELHVEEGGTVTGAAGASLTVGGLLNEGTIRIAGGRINQELVLPSLYAFGAPGIQTGGVGIRQFSDVFSVRPDGTIDPAAFSVYDPNVRNQILATGLRLYKLGVVDQGQGVVLAEGSVTDLSGAVILNPRAIQADGSPLRAGVVVGGGSLSVSSSAQVNRALGTLSPYRFGGSIVAEAGSRLDLSGAAGVFDRSNGRSFVATDVWSDAGTLGAYGGVVLDGAADIRAVGGAAQARDGTLIITDPIFSQRDPETPAVDVISAQMIDRAGFDTLVAIGTITSDGDATISLDRAFFLETRPFNAVGNALRTPDALAPVISTGGDLVIEAGYIGLRSQTDIASPGTPGLTGDGSVTFRANQIDVTGLVRFDQSVARAALEATGDIRLTGVPTWQGVFSGTLPGTIPTLAGGLYAHGDLSLTAAQIYPTTGSSFSIFSLGEDATIRFGRSGEVPATPYSAGGNLIVQAANIVQSGVIRVPFGTLTLGSNAPATRMTPNLPDIILAPATQSVVLTGDSVTSVSADGLSIPYGTTTDVIEWYFTPTGTGQLSGPPIKVLSLSGDSVTIAEGATVDLSGGGDVYAYEFVPGTGGSRDILSRFNSDPFSGNFIDGVGYQYADARQVYAIVPGLSDAPTAAYDPLYSAGYDLNTTSGVGRRVYLSGGNGLAAGWYTLLPAQYAMLPGGMQVVEQTEFDNVVPGASSRRADGTLTVAGYYGDALSGASESTNRLFSVRSQDVIRSYSSIVLTSGNGIAQAQATDKGLVTPRIGLDAGRLALNPLSRLTIDAALKTQAATGGRGSQVDISGTNLQIVSDLAAPVEGTIQLTAASLNNLKAESLLIGGTRTDNADGTTSLTVSARTLRVANDAANPLVAPEIVLVVDDGLTGDVASELILEDGATLTATGVLSDQRDGAYVIDGRVIDTPTGPAGNNQFVYSTPRNSAIGALFRVANGPQRVVQRLRNDAVAGGNPGSPAGPAATLTVGAVDVNGTAIGLDTSNFVSVASAARLRGRDIALGATAIAFTGGAAPEGAVVISPELQAVLSQGDVLTLRSQTSIGFADGDYVFGDTTFDAASLIALDGGSVNLAVDALTLRNSGAAGTAVAGNGILTIVADETTFGQGTFAASGFDTVDLTSAGGVFSGGRDGVFDLGAADLRLVAPYIGDRNVSGELTEQATDLTLKTTGAVAITNAGTTPLDMIKVAGVPGSSLGIEAGDLTIAGTHLRATAGTLSLESAQGLVLSGGARLESPGYVRTLGDAADPRSVSAPAGSLSLTALGAAGISLGDARLSVGGGTGNAGALKLAAPQGAVDFGTAVLDGKAGQDQGGMRGQGGLFALDVRSAVDLTALNTRIGADGFTGGFDVRTREGDLVLAAGQTLRSGTVNLTADGGFVTIAGLIDTSGVNGGDIALFGGRGVTLQGTARLDASASGYAADDSRKASAGDVTLGTDVLPGQAVVQADGSVTGPSGLIDIQSGAIIDVAADRPGDRLVRIVRGQVVNYGYVEGDEGGTVTLRAPVVQNAGVSSVNVSVASADSIRGAKVVQLEGFKRWDLGVAAASGLYSGVILGANGGITLDVRTGLDTPNADGTLTEVAGLNLLGDLGANTVVSFVQGYDVSSGYGRLGGLATRANFLSRPGVDLSHTGDITLASNWNLGAGVVDVTGAIAAGAMAIDPTSEQPYVVVGREGDLLADHTRMTYRVGGTALGAAPLVTLRAGGDLQLKGSLTDGFFQFREQYDALYQGYLNASSGSIDYKLVLPDAFFVGPAVDWATFTNDSSPWSNYGFRFFDGSYNNIDQLGAGGTVPEIFVRVPFSAVANTAAALGTGSNGQGDALASAVVFPLLSGNAVMGSTDYRLVAGAATGVDPLRTITGSDAAFIVDGPRFETMIVDDVLIGSGVNVKLMNPFAPDEEQGSFTFGQTGFSEYAQQFNFSVTDDTSVSLVYANTIPDTLQAFIDQSFADDPNAQIKVWQTDFGFNEVTISLGLFSRFVAGNPDGFGGGGGGAPTTDVPLRIQTMVRTGVGDIRVASGGDIDLTGGPVRYATPNGASETPTNSQGFSPQIGGAAIYTAGRRVASLDKVLADPLTGAPIRVSGTVSQSSVFSGNPRYYYGVQQEDFTRVTGTAGVVVADPVSLMDGGDVALTAQSDIAGRRDFLFSTLPTNGGGAGDQPWRTVTVSTLVTNATINPQRFQNGLGALGGGDVAIDAGGSITDLRAVASASLITGKAVREGAPQSSVLLTVGGGDLAARVGGDISALTADIVSGAARIQAGGDIGSASYLEGINGSNGMRLVALNHSHVRIDDAVVDLSAGGSITLRGIEQLDGFYSPVSALNLVANGSVDITNTFTRTATNLAIYPGTLTIASVAGDIDIVVATPLLGTQALSSSGPTSVLLSPSPKGQLSLLAGGDILATRIAMLDAAPDVLPGLFTQGGFVLYQNDANILTPQYSFPGVRSNMTQGQLERMHNPDTTHADDLTPAYVYAGGDIGDAQFGVTLSLAKQARVSAGQDILNMMFFGQNVSDTDITRIQAGRDITGTSILYNNKPTLLGNTFILGGPGDFMVEAGRDLGPFLNSAVVRETIFLPDGTSQIADIRYPGGIVAVGNAWNPYLEAESADITVMFGVAPGADYDALRDIYVDPANLADLDDDLFVQTPVVADGVVGGITVDRTQPIYAPILIAWVKANATAELVAAGTLEPTHEQAYAVFKALPALRQRQFLIQEVYFNELRAPADFEGNSYLQYTRGYQAVNALFPAELGYTRNDLTGGSNGANELINTGDMDLRLAAIETQFGGDVNILGPGGQVLAGSVVATAEQAARRNFFGHYFFNPSNSSFAPNGPLIAIPPGLEGVQTLRGGGINTFTDGDFLLNQSRLFTNQGGNITMWSSNADLNAGQGAKTTANFPPVEINFDKNASVTVEALGGVTGAGIAALRSTPDSPPADVYLLAPRGTVDAGDAGVRASGNVSVAALTVANADNFDVEGQSFGVPVAATADVAANVDSSSAAAAAVQEAAQALTQSRPTRPLTVTVTIEGFGEECPEGSDSDRCPIN